MVRIVPTKHLEQGRTWPQRRFGQEGCPTRVRHDRRQCGRCLERLPLSRSGGHETAVGSSAQGVERFDAGGAEGGVETGQQADEGSDRGGGDDTRWL